MGLAPLKVLNGELTTYNTDGDMWKYNLGDKIKVVAGHNVSKWENLKYWLIIHPNFLKGCKIPVDCAKVEIY